MIAVSIFISEQGAVYFFQSVQIKGGGDLLLSAPFSRCRFYQGPQGRVSCASNNAGGIFADRVDPKHLPKVAFLCSTNT